MTTLEARSEAETVASRSIGNVHEPCFSEHRCSSEELFRWARVLDQADPVVVGRHRAVFALVEAAHNDRELLLTTRQHALRAVREGIGILSTVRLLDAAFDKAYGQGHWGTRPVCTGA